MIPSKIKIECFAERCHIGTLGGRGLSFLRLVTLQSSSQRKEGIKVISTQMFEKMLAQAVYLLFC